MSESIRYDIIIELFIYGYFEDKHFYYNYLLLSCYNRDYDEIILKTQKKTRQ